MIPENVEKCTQVDMADFPHLPKIVITAFTFIFWLHCVIAACDSDLLEELIQMKLITASHLECLVVSNAVQHFLINSLERFPAQSDGQWHSVTFLPHRGRQSSKSGHSRISEESSSDP